MSTCFFAFNGGENGSNEGTAAEGSGQLPFRGELGKKQKIDRPFRAASISFFPLNLLFFSLPFLSTPPLLLPSPLKTSFQDEVGIRHGRYANKIADHVADIHWETSREQEDAAKAADEGDSGSSAERCLRAAAADRRVTLCVEGNISAGKSSFLRFIADECVELQDVIEVVPEPVDKWQAVGPDRVNVLEQVRRTRFFPLASFPGFPTSNLAFFPLEVFSPRFVFLPLPLSPPLFPLFFSSPF
jgi:hypothetical protein